MQYFFTNKLFFLLLLLFFLSKISFAQITLSGTVMDSEKTGIAFANVILLDVENEELQEGTITDEEGAFQLSIAKKGNYELRISFMGYQERRQNLRLEQSLALGAIELQATANNLEEVVVTGKRAIIERKEDKLVFNVASSPLREGYDGLEVLQGSPNIWVDSNGSILMRNANATVLINGRKVNLSGSELANYIRNLDAENIKRIEIQSTPSANMDAETSGGVINIVLKKNPVGFNGNIRSFYTYKRPGFYTLYSGLRLNYGAPKWNIYGGYNHRNNENRSETESAILYDLSDNILETDRTSRNGIERSNYQLGFVLEPRESHSFGVEFFGTTTAFEADNLSDVRLSNQGEPIEKGITSVEEIMGNDLYNTTLNYRWKIDSLGSVLRLFADYADQKSSRINEAESIYEVGAYSDILEQNDSRAKTQIYAFQADLEKYFSRGFKLETGAKVTTTDRENSLLSEYFIDQVWIENDRSTAFNYGEEIWATYASLSTKIKEKSFLKVGLRVEYTDLKRVDLEDLRPIEQNYLNWFPSLYFSRTLTDKQSLTFSYLKSIRRPSFTVLNNNVKKINDFRFELGNPDLGPEYIHKYELSWTDKKQTVSLYYNQTEEAINGVFFLEEDIAYYKRFNSGAQRQVGLEYNRAGALFPWWYLKFTGRAFHRKFIDETGQDRFVRNTVYFNCYQQFQLKSIVNLEVSAYFLSPRADAFYVAEERYSANLVVQKWFFNKKLNCKIMLNDAFNTLEYANERSFETFTTRSNRKPLTRKITLWAAYNFAGKTKIKNRRNKSKNDARGRL